MGFSLPSACLAEVWEPGLGDPSLGGLALTALYVLASALFLRTVLTARLWVPGERRLWWLSTLVVLALAVNKQTDLHHLAQKSMHCLVLGDGREQIDWLKHRLGAALLALGTLCLLWFLYASRRALSANRPLVLGLVLMALFIALEAARFLDILNYPLAEVIEVYRLHRLLEGLALVTLCAAAWDRARRP